MMLKTRESVFIFGLIFCSAISLIHAQTRGRMRVVFDDGRENAYISVIRENGVLYASIGDIGEVLRLRSVFVPEKKKIVLRVGSRSIKVTAYNPFVLVDDKPYQMVLPSLFAYGEIYIPLAIFVETVGEFFPFVFDFKNSSSVLKILNLRYNITAIGIEEKINGYVIRMTTTKYFKEDEIAVSYNRRWLKVNVLGGVIDSARIASERRIGIVEKIVPFQFENSIQVSFLLNQDIAEHNLYSDKNEIVISLRSSKELDEALLESINNERKRWLIDRIIIDPGHGGKHPGAIGPRGTKEKDVTLDIARRLKRLLEKRLGVEVLMTREDDSFVGLKERTQFANEHEGKLFISIHTNGNKNRMVRGFSTWFLGRGKTEEALQVAEKENSVIKFEDSSEIYDQYKDASHILNAIAQNSYLKESEDLAQMVNESMKKITTLSPWGKGVYQAHFYVLIGAAMPSILVETAFISNRYEERLLRTRSFRQKIAEALYEAVERFKKKYEKGIG